MLSNRQIREVFHFCFLERLLKISDPDLYAVKGGMNLRFFFGSPLYCEDMDVDVLGGSVATLKRNGYKILDETPFRRALRAYGIASIEVNDPSKAQHTETVQRFRVQLVTTNDDRLPSTIEFSHRTTVPRSGEVDSDSVAESIAQAYKLPSFRCTHYSASAALMQHALSLAGRAVTQARDVFDMWMLLNQGYGKDLNLHRAIGERECKAALTNLASLGFDDFSGQVAELLENKDRATYVTADMWKTMTEQVKRLIARS